MFERLTAQSRHTVVAAQQAANTLGHDTIDSAHLLLGLLAAQGLGAQVLAEAGPARC